jgi:predicted nucleic acid-binding protein
LNALLDTSFFVARESGRPLAELGDIDETEVSVVTVAELTIGVLVADDHERARRVATLAAVESTWDPLPVDIDVARVFARLVADLRSRQRRAPIIDSLLAATAIAHGMPIVTQDRDYDRFDGLQVIKV